MYTKNRKLCYDEYVLIFRDAGIVWNKQSINRHIILYKNLETNILLIDGNNENFDMLNNYDIEVWNSGRIHRISEHIFHLMRG